MGNVSRIVEISKVNVRNQNTVTETQNALYQKIYTQEQHIQTSENQR